MMEGGRFDALTRSAQASSRRALLAGTMGGLLTMLPLARGSEDAGARNNRNRRRNRKQTWKLSAHPLTYLDEHPASGGDSSAYNSKAQITITRRRNRFQICATFQYYTSASSTNQINVKDVIIQTGNTSHTTPAVFTFAGWTAANVHDAGCQRIDRDLAQDIVNDPGTYHVNLRTNHPHHPNGAVAAPLTHH
jgi:hypothetical protein